MYNLMLLKVREGVYTAAVFKANQACVSESHRLVNEARGLRFIEF